MNPNMMQLLGRINPQVMQQPIINPVQARLRRPQIDQTTIAEAPQPTIYSTPVAEQESQVYSTPQAQADPLRGRLITPPHDFEGDAQAEKDAIARAGAEREAINQENARPMPMYIGPNAKGYDDLDPNLHPEFSSLADRMRRKEISDEGADIKKLPEMGNPTTLKDILKHPSLYKMYPDLKNINVTEHTSKDMNGYYAPHGYWGGEPKISLNLDKVKGNDNVKSTLLHEVQHAIQNKEDFAQGGTSEEFTRGYLNQLKDISDQISAINENLKHTQGTEKYNELLDMRSELAKEYQRLHGASGIGPYEKGNRDYKNLAGEVEARDTQARMDMTIQDRLKKEPLSSQGVRPQDMIVRRLKGGVSNSGGESKPITAYHKTNADFEEFDPSKVGENDYGYAGQGVYLTPKPLGGLTYGKNTLKTEVNLKNPYVRTSENWKSDPLNPYTWIAKKSESDGIPLKDASKMWTDMMKEKGYDGFIDKTSPNGEIVVFDTKQVKIISNNKENK